MLRLVSLLSRRTFLEPQKIGGGCLFLSVLRRQRSSSSSSSSEPPSAAAAAAEFLTDHYDDKSTDNNAVVTITARIVRRICGSCRLIRDCDEYFSFAQLTRTTGVARCTACIAQGHQPRGRLLSCSWNDSSKVAFTRDALEKNPIKIGTRYIVAKGTFTNGPRQGQACVAKWLNTTTNAKQRQHQKSSQQRSTTTTPVVEKDNDDDDDYYDDCYFDLDLQRSLKAHEIIEKFNNSHVIEDRIHFMYPDVYRFEKEHNNNKNETTVANNNKKEDTWNGRLALVFPYLDPFYKSNSNTGWTVPIATEWHNVMQSLSHYSYRATAGHFCLCDLQGSLNYDENAVYLQDPVLLSRDQRFGAPDLGAAGISTFFSTHQCGDNNAYCDAEDWHRPVDRKRYYAIRRGTMYRPKHIINNNNSDTNDDDNKDDTATDATKNEPPTSSISTISFPSS